jgi:Rad3-related DNA helicase
MCVSRGKMSEDINYKDNLARACLIIGIPYLLVNDPRVNLKKTYLDNLQEMESEVI